MSIRSKILATAAALALLGGTGLAATAGTAQASSLSCTSKTACGGATLAYAVKGNLALAVLAPDANTNGGFGYWNEPAGFAAQDYPSGTGYQDFTVFQESGTVTCGATLASCAGIGQGGQFGHGEDAVVYTPGGNLPLGDTAFGGNGSQTAYCLSVQDVYRTVRGHLVQRWADALRPCDEYIGGPLQSAAPVFRPVSSTNPFPTVTGADPYQLWAPVEVAGGFLEFQNAGLDNSSFYRHGYGGESFVLDDTAFGGTGTQGLAFPENDGANQLFRIIGCTPPITTFSTVYYNCPAA